ncbi:DUF4190 domain-containing protein [Streptomyces sp. NPDC059009]|uniref:DUF4190 domain-containing protein n=1 Tax=Streptomyces sp. NPDC059009 TaxID=3346694 RepID=UPI0036D0DCF4
MSIPPPPGPGSPQQPQPQQPQGGALPSYPSYPSHPDQSPYAGGQQHQQQMPYGAAYPGQQPGGPPYQPWPGYYSPHSAPPVNGFAIASLVFGVLCFFPLIGLILGLVALSQIKKKGERGKGLAIAGNVLSSVGAVLLVLFFATGAARDFADGFKDAAEAARDLNKFPVAKGGCFNAPDNDLAGMKYAHEVDKVSCDEQHTGEVFASFRVNNSRFPGDSELTALAERKCTDFQADYVPDLEAVPSNVAIYYYVPSRTTWRQGDRHITCLFGNADEGGTLTGSLRDGDPGGGDGGGGGADGGSDGGGGADVGEV